MYHFNDLVLLYPLLELRQLSTTRRPIMLTPIQPMCVPAGK